MCLTIVGKIPRCHVNLEHVDIYLTQKKNKRKLLIQKFINLCVESKVTQSFIGKYYLSNEFFGIVIKSLCIDLVDFNTSNNAKHTG